MRFFIVIFVLFYCFSGWSQNDFLKVQSKIIEVRKWQKAEQEKVTLLIKKMPADEFKDTAKVRSYLRTSHNSIEDSVLAVAKQIINLTFPDVNFISSNNETLSISDFSGKNIVLNYNRFFCEPCLNIIDSIIKLANKDSCIIVALFSDKYKQETIDLSKFDKDVIIGFINEENKEFIALTFGDNFRYYINTNRQIEFFDKLSKQDSEFALATFLSFKK